MHTPTLSLREELQQWWPRKHKTAKGHHLEAVAGMSEKARQAEKHEGSGNTIRSIP